jgi:hypothetical protein
VSVRKVFQVVVEKVYEVDADSLEEARAVAEHGDISSYIVESYIVSVHEVAP